MIRVKVKRVNTLKESKDKLKNKNVNTLKDSKDKLKNKNVNTLKDKDKRVNEPYDKDIVGIPSDLKRLSKGIVEEDYDETIYLKIKEIERLNKEIEVLKSQVMKLNKLKGKLKCPPPPTTSQLFNYCSKLADASKGKFDDKK